MNKEQGTRNKEQETRNKSLFKPTFLTRPLLNPENSYIFAIDSNLIQC